MLLLVLEMGHNFKPMATGNSRSRLLLPSTSRCAKIAKASFQALALLHASRHALRCTKFGDTLEPRIHTNQAVGKMWVDRLTFFFAPSFR